jgi:predicted nucleic acid-binding protein
VQNRSHHPTSLDTDGTHQPANRPFLILGGPAYDALIAFTAAEHQATLMSLDQRAAATYEAIGITVGQLAS